MIALAIVVVVIAAVLAWNTIPKLRKLVQGWSTVLETVIGAGLYGFGILADAVQEAQKLGYLPKEWIGFVPYILCAYLLIKRAQTKTPLGAKK